MLLTSYCPEYLHKRTYSFHLVHCKRFSLACPAHTSCPGSTIPRVTNQGKEVLFHKFENKRESIPAFLSADKGLSCCCTQVVITFKKAADAQLIECTWCIRQNATQIKQLNLKRPQNQGSHVGLEAGKCLNVEVLQTWDISWRNPTSNIFDTV